MKQSLKNAITLPIRATLLKMADSTLSFKLPFIAGIVPTRGSIVGTFDRNSSVTYEGDSGSLTVGVDEPCLTGSGLLLQTSALDTLFYDVTDALKDDKGSLTTRFVWQGSTASTCVVWSLNDNSANNVIQIAIDVATSVLTLTVITGGTTVATIESSTNTIIEDIEYRCAVTWKAGTVNFFHNAVLIGSASCTLPTGLNYLMVGQDESLSSQLDGVISHLHGYKGIITANKAKQITQPTYLAMHTGQPLMDEDGEVLS